MRPKERKQGFDNQAVFQMESHACNTAAWHQYPRSEDKKDTLKETYKNNIQNKHGRKMATKTKLCNYPAYTKNYKTQQLKSLATHQSYLNWAASLWGLPNISLFLVV